MRPQDQGGARAPCVRLKKALYGLPRSGFDWFSHCDSLIVDQLGRSRASGVDSLYAKTDALLAVYVDDLVLAGTGHARRREWAAMRAHLKMRDAPNRLGRFLAMSLTF